MPNTEIPFTNKHEAMLQDTHDAIIRIESKLNNGMCDKLDDVCDEVEEVKLEITKNTTARKIGTWFVGLMGAAILAFVIGLLTGQIRIIT